ncbi:MAG: PAS domain S-box protein [Dehalococcoidia bacterium]|nr:PAS domain S-box protein [Dehalococcoidia bacterium]
MRVVVANSTPDYSQQASIGVAGEASKLSLDKPVGKRKQAEEALKDSEERFRSLVESTSDWIWEIDRNGIYTYASPKVKELLGYEPEKVIGKTPFDFMPAEEANRVANKFKDIIKNNKPIERLENTNLHKDGHLVTLETSGVPIFNSKGQLRGYRGVDRDITERKQAEEALQGSEEKYRLIAENASDVIWTLDKNLKCTYISPSVTKVRGYTSEEAMAQSAEEAFTPSSAEAAVKAFTEELAIESLESKDISRVRTLEVEHTCKNGSAIWCEVKASFIRDAEGQPVGLLGISREITERRKSEEALRRSEERYRTILEEIEDSYFEVDLAGNLTFINDAVCHHLGYSREELLGMNYRAFTAEGDTECVYQAFNEVYRTGEPNKGFLWNVIKKDGSIGFADASVSVLRDREGKIVGFRGIGRDMTERKKEEQKMLTSGKLASVGEITASVAHEINNPLTGVLGYAQLLTSRHDIPQDIKQDLDIIYEECQRAVKIVQSLLHFARQHKPDRSLTDISELVERTLELQIYKLRTSNIMLTTKLAADLPWVVVDYNQIQQVILNIVVNAMQAMAEVRHEGKITVATGMNKDYVRISIADNGPGIAKENINKVFDPFFTTKPVGSGSGLGLSVCHSIITEHGGNIRVESTNGKGATFIIDLPVATGDEAVIKEKAVAEKKRPRRRQKVGESILIVEDEPAIRGILTEVLSEEGYQVHTASSGKDALTKLEEGLHNIYIVDLKMPDMSGEQLYKIMKNKYTKASERVIFMTGDTITPETQNLLVSTGRPFLSKPFDYTELIKMVEETTRKR